MSQHQEKDYYPDKRKREGPRHTSKEGCTVWRRLDGFSTFDDLVGHRGELAIQVEMSDDEPNIVAYAKASDEEFDIEHMKIYTSMQYVRVNLMTGVPSYVEHTLRARRVTHQHG